MLYATHTIVPQCQAGISRIPAIAAAIALLYPCNETYRAIQKRYPAFNVELFQAIIDEWIRRRWHTFSLSSGDVYTCDILRGAIARYGYAV
jgi:protein-tyrosine phosphatase